MLGYRDSLELDLSALSCRRPLEIILIYPCHLYHLGTEIIQPDRKSVV